MGRLKLTRRVDEHGNTVAVFSKGAGSFSVQVVEDDRQRPATTEADSEVQQVVKRTSIGKSLPPEPAE